MIRADVIDAALDVLTLPSAPKANGRRTDPRVASDIDHEAHLKTNL